jgi:Fe(3+) dicitrate transport protein
MGLGAADHLTGVASATTQVVPLLGLGAVYSFDVGLSVLAGVHQGFSPVAPGQAADVKPEAAVNSELGLRFSRSGVRLEAIGFWSEYSNLTGECTGSTGCVGDQVNLQFNGGRARVLGLEVLGSVKKRVGAGFTLAGDVTYTLTSAHFLSDFTSENSIWGNVVAGDELPYVPLHEGQLRVRVEKGPVELGVGAAFVGDVRERAGQGVIDDAVKVPARVLFDAQASVDLGSARVYVTATNLGNQSALVSRRPFGARPVAPFMFQLGFKYAFR